MTQKSLNGVLENKTKRRIGNTLYIVKSTVNKDVEKLIVAKIGIIPNAGRPDYRIKNKTYHALDIDKIALLIQDVKMRKWFKRLCISVS